MYAESLDNLQTLVENKFSDVRNTGRKRFSFYGHPCSSEHLQVDIFHLLKIGSKVKCTTRWFFLKCKVTWTCLIMEIDDLQVLVKAVPIKQGHTLRILWPITPNIQHYKEGPCKYVSHLVGHEGKGSLFYVLKKLGKFYMRSLTSFLVGWFGAFWLAWAIWRNMSTQSSISMQLASKYYVNMDIGPYCQLTIGLYWQSDFCHFCRLLLLFRLMKLKCLSMITQFNSRIPLSILLCD